MSRTRAWAATAIGALTQKLHFVGLGAILLLMLLTSADVVGRYFFNKPIKGALEVSELTLVVVVWFGVAYAAVRGRHVSIDLVASRLSPRVRRLTAAFNHFLGFVIFSVLAWQGARAAIRAWEDGLTTEVLHIPVFPFKFVVPLGALMMSLVFLAALFTTRRPGGEAE